MGKLAFLFAGQGAQYPGMGREISRISLEGHRVFALADTLRPGTSDQCFSGTAEELAVTKVTQPCLFSVDLACGRALSEKGFVPDFTAGFSLGEIAALAFTGALADEDAFQLVVRRAELMDHCSRQSGSVMLAVLGLDAAAIDSLAAGLDRCYPANYNGPGQTVVACPDSEAQTLAAAVKERGGKTMRLRVSGGFHSPFMTEAGRLLAEEFDALTFFPPGIPLISNVTARPYGGRELLFQQVTSPLLWQESIAYLAGQGVDTYVELGPGKTLCGLVHKIQPEARTCHVQDEGSLLETMTALDEVNA